MYKYLLIDADNTLLDFDKSEESALEMALKQFPIGFNDEIHKTYHQINIDEWKKLEVGKTTREKLKVERFDRLYKHFGLNDDSIGTKTARVYESCLSNFGYTIDGAEYVLSELYKKYKIYVITNGSTSIQVPRMEKSGLNKYISHTFISEDLGVTKPSVEFFKAVLDFVGDYNLNNYLVIGDSLSSDILGAENIGMDSVWLTSSTEKSSAKFTVSNLRELLSIL